MSHYFPDPDRLERSRRWKAQHSKHAAAGFGSPRGITLHLRPTVVRRSRSPSSGAGAGGFHTGITDARTGTRPTRPESFISGGSEPGRSAAPALGTNQSNARRPAKLVLAAFVFAGIGWRPSVGWFGFVSIVKSRLYRARPPPEADYSPAP